MANPQSEVTFESGGKVYTLKLGTYGLAVLQRRTKMSARKFIQMNEGDWGADDLLNLFYSGLAQNHELTEKEVAGLVDKIGTERVGELIVEALRVAYPDAEAAKGTQNPPT